MRKIMMIMLLLGIAITACIISSCHREAPAPLRQAESARMAQDETRHENIAVSFVRETAEMEETQKSEHQRTVSDESVNMELGRMMEEAK